MECERERVTAVVAAVGSDFFSSAVFLPVYNSLARFGYHIGHHRGHTPGTFVDKMRGTLIETGSVDCEKRGLESDDFPIPGKSRQAAGVLCPACSF